MSAFRSGGGGRAHDASSQGGDASGIGRTRSTRGAACRAARELVRDEVEYELQMLELRLGVNVCACEEGDIVGQSGPSCSGVRARLASRRRPPLVAHPATATPLGRQLGAHPLPRIPFWQRASSFDWELDFFEVFWKKLRFFVFITCLKRWTGQGWEPRARARTTSGVSSQIVLRYAFFSQSSNSPRPMLIWY